MKTALVTFCTGEFYQKIAEHSFPLMQRYAERIGAAFICGKTTGRECVGYEKLHIIRDALKQYDRVLYLDADILIRRDAPNIFDIVPEDALGVFDESKVHNRQGAKQLWCQQTGMSQQTKGWLDTLFYFNSGVMVVSKAHLKLFTEPAEDIDNFYEQTLLNARVAQYGTKVFKLSYKYNRTADMTKLTGEDLRDAYFVHYAGAFGHEDYRQANLLSFINMAQDLDEYEGQYLKRHIYIQCGGGLGDQIASEPLVRYLRDQVYPYDTFVIKSTWPEVFKHLKCKDTTVIGEGITLPDTGFRQIDLMPKHHPLNFNQMHPLDFFSIIATGGQIPEVHRSIKLPTLPVNPFQHLDDAILLHAGRSWPSKTAPKQWWQDVLSQLQTVGRPIILIGQQGDHTGYVDIVADDCIDMRDKLSLLELFTLIENAPLLVTNDSAPVHIAGAFNTPTVLINTCKHPDFIFAHGHRLRATPMGRARYAEVVSTGLDDIDISQVGENEIEALLPPTSVVKHGALRMYGAGR